MVVVVVVPDHDGLASGGFAGVGAGVEAFVGEDPLVALDFSVVAGCVGPGALVAADECAGRSTKRRGCVVAAVVGDQPGDPGDAVGGEERAGAGEESDGRHCVLVLERLGVRQAGVAVLHGVQVGVAALLLVGALAGESLLAAAAMGPPAAAVGNLTDLLDVHVNHVAGIAGGDLPW